MRPGGLVEFSSFFQSFCWVPLACSPVSPSGKPQNLLTQLLWCLLEWNYNQMGKCSLFVQLYVPKVILGTLSWCALVVCQTLYPSGKDCNPLEQISAHGMNSNLSEPTKSILDPQRESHFWHPWVGSKEVAGSQGSGLAALGFCCLQLSLKLPIWWFDKAGEYLFPGRKCPHICKGICWWQMNGSPTQYESDAANASPVVS